ILLVAFAAQPTAETEERAGSSEIAGPDGTKALYQYLDRVGFGVTRSRTADLPVPDGGVLVVIAADLSAPEAETLVDRVSRGLSLLVAGDDPTDPLLARLGLATSGGGAPGRALPAFPSPCLQGVDRVEVTGSLRASLAGGAGPAKRGGASGAGWVELLAD